MDGFTIYGFEEDTLMSKNALADLDMWKEQAESIMKTKQSELTVVIFNALKAKLNDIAANELNFQRKKLSNFDEEQAELISSRIIQKITNHFASHLKDENTSVDESIDFIEKVFQIGQQLPVKTISIIEEKYKITLS